MAQTATAPVQTFTVKGKHLTPGMVVNFGGELGFRHDGVGEYIGSAEVLHAEGPDGLGDWVDAYVRPEPSEEDPHPLPFHVQAWPERDYPLEG